MIHTYRDKIISKRLGSYFTGKKSITFISNTGYDLINRWIYDTTGIKLKDYELSLSFCNYTKLEKILVDSENREEKIVIGTEYCSITGSLYVTITKIITTR